MTQEVKVDLQLHIEVNTLLSKEDIRNQLRELVMNSFENNLIALDIYSVQEETEIYGNKSSTS